MKIAVTGATSRVGNGVAQHLLKEMKDVRVISRDISKLENLVSLGAKPYECNPSNREKLGKIFSEVDIAYIMLQPNYIIDSDDFRQYQNTVIKSIITAVKISNLKNIVVLSSWGAQENKGSGSVLGLHNLEIALSNIPNINVLFIRPGYFMENILSQIPNIINEGNLQGLFDPHVKFPFIYTKDISEYIGKQILNFNYKGKNTVELHGSEDLNMNEVTKKISYKLHMGNLQYKQNNEIEERLGMEKAGYLENVIDIIIETTNALNSKKIRMIEQRDSQNTTKTSFNQFLENVFVPLYHKNLGKIKD